MRPRSSSEDLSVVICQCVWCGRTNVVPSDAVRTGVVTTKKKATAKQDDTVDLDRADPATDKEANPS